MRETLVKVVSRTELENYSRDLVSGKDKFQWALVCAGYIKTMFQPVCAKKVFCAI